MAIPTISQEEFQRMQTQLLDLRTANYTLQEESAKHKFELKSTLQRYEQLEKEHLKLQKTLDRSRKAKDVEMLFAENEALQRKLLLQEEEFRLQNKTILEELSLVVSNNEKLEASIKTRDENSFPQTSSQSCQCDLLTEDYEEAIKKEYIQLEELKNELSLKTLLINELKAKEKETEKVNIDKIAHLMERIEALQLKANKVPELIEEMESLWHRISELEKNVEILKKECIDSDSKWCNMIAELKRKHGEEILVLSEENEEKMKDYEIQLEVLTAQKIEFEEEIIRLKQEAQDAIEDARIAERRILTATQDMRRQFRNEKRRADKLQERLREVLSDGTTQVPRCDTATDNDNCSVSSWSLMSGQNEVTGAIPTTPSSPHPRTESPGSGSELNRSRSTSDVEQPPDLATENARLVTRLASMQQEKWRLEERVSHLEETNAAMVEEFVRRGKLIQHYCMESKLNLAKTSESSHSSSLTAGDKLSVRRVVSLIRHIGSDTSEESSGEVQRRLHLMLEETLTKNMHLQEDLERLSREVVRLSQLVGSSQINNEISKPVSGNPVW